MFGMGMGELLIILVIVLLVFGASKLPQIGDALGRSIKNFKRSSGGQDELEVSKKSELTSGRDDADDADVVPASKKKETTR